MDYKGYKILATVRIWQDWTIETASDGMLYLAEYVRGAEDGGLGISDIDYFWIGDNQGQEADFGNFKTLDEAKSYIDQLIKEAK